MRKDSHLNEPFFGCPNMVSTDMFYDEIDTRHVVFVKTNPFVGTRTHRKFWKSDTLEKWAPEMSGISANVNTCSRDGVDLGSYGMILEVRNANKSREGLPLRSRNPYA
jgi:hypothetical protein